MVSSLCYYQTTLLFILLLSSHICFSLSSPTTTSSPSSSLLQSQKSKNSNWKSILASIDKEEKLSSPKSPKKKPISEEKQENLISSSKTPKKKVILEEKFQKPILNPKKKPVLDEKSDKVISSSKNPKKKLNFKEEVEKLLSTSDPVLPLKKKTKTVAESKDQKDQKIEHVKPKKTNSTASSISTKNPKKETKNQDSTPLLDETDTSNEIISDLPDLIERLSITSKAYISAANYGIAEGVRPFLGSKFAPIVAPVASVLFLIVPLILLITLLKRLGSCLSLVRHLLVFIQAYLAIYFATLAVTALLTGLEPLRFFYATSASSYTWTQIAQSLGYVVYLVLQLVDLLAVFASSASEGSRALALAQMLVGLAVGLHYYAAVFHRAVMGEPPRANWHVHGVYAACFMLICACARAERRKKAYVGIEGTEEWKKS